MRSALLALLLAGCTAAWADPTVAKTERLLTARTVERPSDPARWLVIGQSNAGDNTTDALWGGAAVQTDVTVRWEGSTLTNWPTYPGPAPYLVDHLLAAGVAATDIVIVVAALPGASYENVRDNGLVPAIADWATLGVSPQVVWMIHGEAETQTADEAADYEDDNVRFASYLHAEWPGVWYLPTEIRHQESGYGAYYAEANASITAACARITGCDVVRTLTPTAITLVDTVHYSTGEGGGVDQVAARAAALVP